MWRPGGILAALVLLSGCFTKDGIVTPYNSAPSKLIANAPTLVAGMDHPTERQVVWLIHLQSRGELAKLTKEQALTKVSLLASGYQCPDFRHVRYERVSQIMATSYIRVACPQAPPPWNAPVTAPLADQVKAAQDVGFVCDEPTGDTATCRAFTVFPELNEAGRQINELTVTVGVSLRGAQEAVANVSIANDYLKFIRVCAGEQGEAFEPCRMNVGDLQLLFRRNEHLETFTQKLLETGVAFRVVPPDQSFSEWFIEWRVEVPGVPHVEDADGDGDLDLIIQLDTAGARHAVWRNDSIAGKPLFVRQGGP